MAKYRKQVIQFAERKSGVVVQFAGMAGIYELLRTHPDYERFAPRLRAAGEKLGEISFEIEDHKILWVE